MSKLTGKAKAKARKMKQIQAKKAEAKSIIPSFIVKLNIDQDYNITYDNANLIDSQISFTNTCIDQLKEQTMESVEDPTTLFGYVFYGNKTDFAASLSEVKKDADLDTHWTELKDMFFNTFWKTTNQKIELSEEFCNRVTDSTEYAPMGAKLGDVASHDYSNLAISVAYTKRFAKMSKVGGVSVGDLAPPELDPKSKLYSRNYIAKVKQALSNFGIEINADWKPGHMVTTLVAI